MIDMRCFICNNEIKRIGLVGKLEITIQMCARCAHILEEAMKVTVTRKEIMISDASLSYLQSDEFSQAFCGECPWNEYEPYRKNIVTGEITQPYHTCPANFDLGSDRCAMKSQFAEVVETLADADKLAGLKRNVRIIL